MAGAWTATRTTSPSREMGPSCAVYLQRHGYVPPAKMLPDGWGRDRVDAACLRRLAPSGAATVMRCHRLSSSLRKLPADIVVRYVLPYVIEADDEDDWQWIQRFPARSGRGCRFRHQWGAGEFRNINDAVEAWSEGDRHRPVEEIFFDYAVCDYDQVVSIHAINMIHISGGG